MGDSARPRVSGRVLTGGAVALIAAAVVTMVVGVLARDIVILAVGMGLLPLSVSGLICALFLGPSPRSGASPTTSRVGRSDTSVPGTSSFMAPGPDAGKVGKPMDDAALDRLLTYLAVAGGTVLVLTGAVSTVVGAIWSDLMSVVYGLVPLAGGAAVLVYGRLQLRSLRARHAPDGSLDAHHRAWSRRSSLRTERSPTARERPET